ncbi:Fas apoptotic inhibitory molecule 3 [Pteropus alecto]|uniref:Fas apoptotic inhibitory molecule 3 n=1 Tax=Pteropus alecto TaxID=9402 RepID=L5JV03_PTEAL|nr:Fas apoptotic inhibitory molecule 3 [Pteropus alecto]
MSALEGSQRPLSQRPRVSQWPRSQNNVYSACPRRAGGAQAAGEREAPGPGPGRLAPSAPPQVSSAAAQISRCGLTERPQTWAWTELSFWSRE